jgi:multidrug efflux pump subunit AcrA (membrane-fusion protein)
MAVRFNTLGRPDRGYESRLLQIWPTPEVVNNVVLYSALFEVPNRDGALLPQMSAQVFFVRAEARDVVMVPLAALSGLSRRPNAPPPTVQVQRDDGTWTVIDYKRHADASPGSPQALQVARYVRAVAALHPGQPVRGVLIDAAGVVWPVEVPAGPP